MILQAIIPVLEVFSSSGLEARISSLSVRSVFYASIILMLLIAFASLKKSHSHILFGLIVAVVSATSIFLIGSTVYLNTVSSSKGPVHWHADFEVWACGEELELKDPDGFLSNKIGTNVLHEHNDKRIHQEGVVVNERDASLGNFMNVIGGQVTGNTLVLPTNENTLSYVNGQACGEEPGEVQVFVYKTTDDDHYYQEKIASPENYVMSPYSGVPPGDCIIIEFDNYKERTDKLCRSFKVAEEIDRLKGEINGN
jgi:hypothetical protein